MQDQGAQLVGSCCLVTGSTSEVTYLIFGNNNNLLPFSLNTIVFMSGVQTKILKFKSSFAVFQTDSEVRCFLFIFINVITTNCIFTIRVLRLMGQSCI